MSATDFTTYHFDDDGRTPNNVWPVVIHHQVAAAKASDAATALEQLLRDNDWPPQWRGGVFDYHHYHANAHEALAVTHGSARLMLGGENGQSVTISPGDVVILPAGTGHCRLQASPDFSLIGSYPFDQQDWDLCRSGQVDIASARERIARLPRPATDPVSGAEGGLLSAWQSR